MSWKVKEEYKGHKPINFNLPLEELSQSQIEGLKEGVRGLYFEKGGATTKKVKKSFKPTKIEDL